MSVEMSSSTPGASRWSAAIAGAVRPKNSAVTMPRAAQPNCRFMFVSCCDRSQSVRAATLVEPCDTPFVSRNRTKTRDVAGANGITPLKVTNTANVPVSPAARLTDTDDDKGPVHAEVLGFDLHNAAVSGSGSPWVSTNAVNPPAAPTLTVATAKALVAFTAPETMPLLPAVAASAIMSVTGVAENSRLGMSRPITSAAGGVPSQVIASGCANGPVATEDWNASRKFWPPLPAIETGWLGDPVSCPLPDVVW